MADFVTFVLFLVAVVSVTCWIIVEAEVRALRKHIRELERINDLHWEYLHQRFDN